MRGPTNQNYKKYVSELDIHMYQDIMCQLSELNRVTIRIDLYVYQNIMCHGQN